MTCKRGAGTLSDTFHMLWPPRTDALPVPGAVIEEGEHVLG
jgi:hypothetical protein